MTHFNILPEHLRSFAVAEAINFGKVRREEIKTEEDRAAKRRRIELQAEKYLRGEPLFISTATLRDPFKAPWLNTRANTSHGRSTGKEIRKIDATNPVHQPRKPHRKSRQKEDASSKDKKMAIEDRGLYVDNPRAIVNSPSKPPPDPEDMAFNPGSASKFTKKWLRRQSSISHSSPPAPDQTVDEIEDDVTPITRSPTANRKTAADVIQHAQSRASKPSGLTHADQLQLQVIEGPIRKKRKLIDGLTDVTSPILNGSQGLQFRRGKRSSKEKSNLSGRDNAVSAGLMKVVSDPIMTVTVGKAPTVTSASTELSTGFDSVQAISSRITDSLNLAPTIHEVSVVQACSRIPTDITRSVPNLSAAPSIHTDFAESTAITRSIPPDHQVEASEPGEPTAEPPTISHEPTADYTEEPSMAEDTYAAAMPVLCTQAAFEQAQSALDDVFATPMTSFPSAEPAGTTAIGNPEEPNGSQSANKSTRRPVTLLDTPGLERMAAEVAFASTMKNPNFTEPASVLINNTPIPTPIFQFNRSFPPTEATPRPFGVTRKSLLASTPLVTDTPRIPTTVLRKDSTLNNTLVTAPLAPPSASMPEHQPSFDFDIDLDSCLREADGLLGTGDLDSEIKGVMRSLGSGSRRVVIGGS